MGGRGFLGTNANLLQDISLVLGILIALTLTVGMIMAVRKRYDTHPNTGKRFVGLRIPWFDEGRKMALSAHKKLAPEAITLGWDIGLCEGAPVLLEVNVWTACYDYDPQTDAFTPSVEAILRALR